MNETTINVCKITAPKNLIAVYTIQPPQLDAGIYQVYMDQGVLVTVWGTTFILKVQQLVRAAGFDDWDENDRYGIGGWQGVVWISGLAFRVYDVRADVAGYPASDGDHYEEDQGAYLRPGEEA